MSPSFLRFAPAASRGFAVLVVLALVSITLALSYSIMRSQMTGIQIQNNSDRGDFARQAALAGISAGLRNMRVSSWAGVGTPLTGSLSSTDTFSVSFTSGDPSLSSASVSYSDYSYRVTLLSTGTSVDPAHPTVKSTYKVQAVVRLVARQVTAPPSNYSTMLGYTLYEMSTGSNALSVPCHIDGPVRLQGAVDVENGYHWNDNPQKQYYTDLNSMRTASNEVQIISRTAVIGGTFSVTFNGATTGSIAYNASASTLQTALQGLSTIGAGNVSVANGGSGVWTVTFTGGLSNTNVPTMSINASLLLGLGSYNCAATVAGSPGLPDCRPFSGPVSLPTNKSDSHSLNLMSQQLGLTLNNISTSTATALPMSLSLTYRLYPGGPLYNFGTLPSSLTNTTLAPDPVANPLGLFYNSSSATLGNNVTITGTVVTGGELKITGTNVKISPFSLQSLDGTTTPIRFPSVVALSNLHVASGATATIGGVVYVGVQLLVDQGAEATALAITGNVIISGGTLTINPRNEWLNYSSNQWDTFYTSYQNQLGRTVPVLNFPQWMATNQGRSYIPLLTVKADPTPLVQQWQDLANPIFIAGSGDTGLHWDLVSWTDHL